MDGIITEKQLKYLNILLTDSFGSQNRKLYLKIFYKVDSSKEITKEQASEIIEKFVDSNPEREKEVAIGLEKIYESLGQQRLI